MNTVSNNTKSDPISKNRKFFEELGKKLHTLTEICTKSNKMIANSSNESFLYNSNNGFHLQEKKLGTRNNAFSFKLKNGFPLSGMKGSFKNNWFPKKKWFLLARNHFPLERISSVLKT